MSWRDRLRQSIILVSPEGNSFEALWRGNPRTVEKKLGIFLYPKVKGAVIQDLDINATRYPLTIYFEGENHDLEGERFFSACGESGTWDIIHPVKGDLTLQLVSASESITPIENGNMTQFDTEWIEPLDEEVVVSAAALQAETESSVDDVNEASSNQLNSNILQTSASAIKKFQSSVEAIKSKVESTLKPIYEASAEINAQMSAVKRGIDDTLSVIPIDVISIAGQIQNLIQLPALAISDIQARLSAYRSFVDSIIGDDFEGDGLAGRNEIASNEIALVSVMAAASELTALGETLNRTQAIDFIESNLVMYDDIINYLDNAQELFITEKIDEQYFSQSESFSKLSTTVALSTAFLLRSIFDLSVEKRIKLKKHRAPIEITITEYGSLGDNDENFDFFIATNELNGDEILILPPGREVVVYV